MLKKILYFLPVLFVLGMSVALAVDPPPIPGDPDPIPVDGGAGLLLAAGATYGIRKLRARRAARKEKS